MLSLEKLFFAEPSCSHGVCQTFAKHLPGHYRILGLLVVHVIASPSQDRGTSRSRPSWPVDLVWSCGRLIASFRLLSRRQDLEDAAEPLAGNATRMVANATTTVGLVLGCVTWCVHSITFLHLHFIFMFFLHVSADLWSKEPDDEGRKRGPPWGCGSEMGFRPMGFRTRPGNSTLGSRNRHVRPDPDPDSASNLH